MLDSILSSAKGYIQDSVAKNTSVPKQQSSVVSDVIFGTVSKSLQSQLGGGAKAGSTGGAGGINLSMLGGLLGGGGKNSSFLDGMSKSVVDALVKKTGMKSPVAQALAASILPGLISSLTKNMGGGGALGNVAGGLLGNLLGGKK